MGTSELQFAAYASWWITVGTAHPHDVHRTNIEVTFRHVYERICQFIGHISLMENRLNQDIVPTQETSQLSGGYCVVFSGRKE